eukprot:scaffold9913_cov141-Isochrysis_galbana.AAC.4
MAEAMAEAMAAAGAAGGWAAAGIQSAAAPRGQRWRCPTGRRARPGRIWACTRARCRPRGRSPPCSTAPTRGTAAPVSSCEGTQPTCSPARGMTRVWLAGPSRAPG